MQFKGWDYKTFLTNHTPISLLQLYAFISDLMHLPPYSLYLGGTSIQN